MNLRTFLVLVVLLATVPAEAAQLPSPRTPDQLAQDGAAFLQAGRYRDAFDAFAAAANARPREVSFYVGASSAAAMLGQLADAQRWVERALQLQPSYTSASILLGQVLFRQGKLQEAVAVYETGLKYAPGNALLTQSLAEWRKEADLQNNFFARRGAHFSVFFEGPSDDVVARKIVDILEEAYYRIGTALMTYPSETINVVLYTQQQFQDVTRSPAWAAGVYDGRIKLPVGGALKQEGELRRVVEHEFVHAVVSSMAGRVVPTWLHEGLAMALEEGGGGGADQILSRISGRVPLAALSRGFMGLTGPQAMVAYAESLQAVKRLIALRGMPSLVSLLHSLGRGADFESAFQQAIFMRFADFEAELARTP